MTTAEQTRQTREEQAKKGLVRYEISGLHPEDRETLKKLALKLRKARNKAQTHRAIKDANTGAENECSRKS